MSSFSLTAAGSCSQYLLHSSIVLNHAHPPFLPGFDTFPSSSESSEEQENGRIGKEMLGGMVGWRWLMLSGQVMGVLNRSSDRRNDGALGILRPRTGRFRTIM